MKRILGVVLVCLLAVTAHATITWTVNLKDFTGASAAARTKVLVTMNRCGSNIPRVSGTGIIVPLSKEFDPNGAGAVSMTLYSKDEVICGGQTGIITYTVAIMRDGKLAYRADYPATTSGDISQMSPLTVLPTVEAPTGDNTYARNDGGNVASVTWAVKTTGDQSVAGNKRFSSLNGIKVVDGITYPLTDAGIQAAIDAVPVGGTVYLPAGTYAVCDSLPITISKSIALDGAGDGSLLQVCPTASATTDIIVVQPASAFLFNLKLRNFFINPSSGTPGRYAIHFDGTTGTADQATLEHLRIGETGSWAIYADGTGAGNGIPRIARIQDSIITGGIKFEKAGDTLEISHNMIDGPRAALDVEFQPGASTLLFEKNNVPAKGGIHIGGSAVATHIFHNEFETISGFTGSNGAFLDIDGTVGAPADGVIVRDNSFQIVNSITSDGVRVNYANGTIIEGNRFYRGATTSKDIAITANATNTAVGKNRWVSGAPITSMVADSGVGTSYGFVINDEYVLKNNTSFTQLDETGTQRGIFRTTDDGTVYFYGYHGTPLARGGGGATYLYDGNGNIASSASGAPSELVDPDTYFTVGKLVADSIEGIQHVRFGPTHAVGNVMCQTGAVAGNTCDNTFNWPVAMGDANYTAVCTVSGVATGVPMVRIGTKSSTQLVVTVVAITAVGAQASEISCSAQHD